MKKFKEGQMIYFADEKLPMMAAAVSPNFIVCTRPLCKKADIGLLKHEVKMRAYSSVEEAYNASKNDPVYTIIDLKNQVKGPHNLVFNSYDFNSTKSMKKLLNDLKSGDVELSRRNSVEFHFDDLAIETDLAFKLKGKRLSKNEKFLISHFHNNKNFVLQKYENGSVGYHMIK